MFRLLLIFIIAPIVELALLLKIADETSWQFTVALLLVTGVVGAALARWQGLVALRRIQADFAQGVPPAAALFDGLLIFIAGAVLITPGVLTDAVGFALLLPPIRRVIREMLAKRLLAHFQIQTPPLQGGASPHQSDAHDRIIDIQVIDENGEPKSPPESDSPCS